LNSAALLKLWDLEDLAACDEGMELAKAFLTSCGRALECVGHCNTLTLRSDFHFRFSQYVAHRESCDKCNEM
jgi:hypothetical protein